MPLTSYPYPFLWRVESLQNNSHPYGDLSLLISVSFVSLLLMYFVIMSPATLFVCWCIHFLCFCFFWSSTNMTVPLLVRFFVNLYRDSQNNGNGSSAFTCLIPGGMSFVWTSTWRLPMLCWVLLGKRRAALTRRRVPAYPLFLVPNVTKENFLLLFYFFLWTFLFCL